MEGSPLGINIKEFENKLLNINGVLAVHDLHIWSLSVGKPAITAHIIGENSNELLEKCTLLCRIYGIYHSTLQVETPEKHISMLCKQNIHK